MKLFLAFIFVAVLLALYVMWGRPALRKTTWGQDFLAWVEPVELALWSKSESILWARFLQVLGVLLTGLQAAGQYDLTPVLPYLPDRLKWVPAVLPLLVSVAGGIQEVLRRDTTKPLAVVAIPDAAPIGVKVAAAQAEVATATAVEAAKAA